MRDEGEASKLPPTTASSNTHIDCRRCHQHTFGTIPIRLTSCMLSQKPFRLFITFCISLCSLTASFYVSAITPSRNSPSLSASMSPLSPTYKTLLVDMDGVLAEVSKSYRAAILATCQTYGANSVTDETVTEWKARGNANDDWKLSHDLIKTDPDGDNDVTLEQVTETFERFYQGHGDTPGLYSLESLIPARETLEELRKRSKPGMGIVTGRPRRDCIKFLQSHNLEHLFDAMYCMEDGPSKPDPFPLKRVCELLRVEPSHSVVLVGDTPDDIQAAVSAGCRGVGVTTPDVAAACEAKGEAHTSATLGIIMMERGADVIMPPGFADLVAMFPAP